MILHALEAGDGPPLALLHGLFGRAQNLAGVARHFSRTRRVISVDLRNHGASPHVQGMTYPAMAEDVRETLTRLGAWPACVLGHSMGGKVAMMLALLHPAQVERLIVADIAPVAYRHGNRAIASAMASIPLRPGLSRSAADEALAGAVAEPAVRGFLLQNLVFSETPHWRIGLAEIAAGLDDIEGWQEPADASAYHGPTCFIVGSKSEYFKPEYRPIVERRFPHCDIVSIVDAGHWLHAEQPQAFIEAVQRALQ